MPTGRTGYIFFSPRLSQFVRIDIIQQSDSGSNNKEVCSPVSQRKFGVSNPGLGHWRHGQREPVIPITAPALTSLLKIPSWPKMATRVQASHLYPQKHEGGRGRARGARFPAESAPFTWSATHVQDPCTLVQVAHCGTREMPCRSPTSWICMFAYKYFPSDDNEASYDRSSTVG